MLGLFIVVLLIGISVGMYLLSKPEIFNPRAATDTFSTCGPSGHCNDYGWNANQGYTTVPTSCYVALYKCHVSDWDKAIAVGCQKNTSIPSKNLAYYAEIHKLSSSNPNPSFWNVVVSGGDGNGHLKPFLAPQFCGVWQIDVGPPCNFSFHSGGDRRSVICTAPTPTPQKHNACQGTSCVSVNGPGADACSIIGPNAVHCSHKACVGTACKLLAGEGTDQCSVVGTNPAPQCTNPSPTLSPSPTPTKTPTPTLTPTPSSCPLPSAVTNLKVSCPLCSQSQ